MDDTCDVAVVGAGLDCVLAVEVRGGTVVAIRAVRNPDELVRVGRPVDLR